MKLRGGAARGWLAGGALCLSVMAPQWAQEGSGQVNGTVLDKNKKGIAGLSVAAIGQPGTTIYGTSTDEGGRYALKGLEASTYSVIVYQHGGGTTRKDSIRVRPLFRSIVDFNVVGTAAPGTIPALEATSAEQAAGAPSLICALSGPDRAPVTDARVSLTPVEGSGQLRRGRTGPQGECKLDEIPAGTYRIVAKAPGFITWGLAPVPLSGSGALKLVLSLAPFPMGFEGTLDDLLVPTDPIPPTK